MEKKIIKIGNSLGIILPATLLEELGVSHKDTVDVEYNSELKTLTISSSNSVAPIYFEQVIKNTVDLLS
ncbi:AbrB/MazE/SpoVT family DNA-binding domain-containing protein [Gottfriedia acidiceleris]|uniref:AbrB/MazE/SpoVT family DNA-binding domain-containing protein n=1 Tax=Gottfriedia acidiceleris TaxID=371036 RepID=UPI003000B016